MKKISKYRNVEVFDVDDAVRKHKTKRIALQIVPSIIIPCLAVIGMIALRPQTHGVDSVEVVSVTPAHGYIGGNNLVTINGTGLDFDPTFVNEPSVDYFLDTDGNAYESATTFMDVSFIGNVKVKEVTNGYVRAVLTENGEVYTTLSQFAAGNTNCPDTISLNDYGQYGNGTTNKTPYTQKVGGLLEGKNIIDIDANNWTGVIAALDDNGDIYTWGRDLDGALGNDATLQSSSLPVKVDLSAVPSGSKIIAVSVGYSFFANSGCSIQVNNNSHILALDDHGKVYAWGFNGQGQLGIGNTTNQPVPVAVSSGALAGKNIVKILAGYRASFAIDDQGKLYAWGTNVRGQLGDGTNTQRNSPVVTNISMTSGTIVAVSNGGYYNYNQSDGYSMILDSAGKIYVFGIVSSLPAGYTSPNIEIDCGWTGNRCSSIALEVPFPAVDPPFIVNILNQTDYTQALGGDGKMYNAITGARVWFNEPRSIIMDPGGTQASCMDITVVSDTEITCVTSAHPEGTVDMEINIGPIHQTLPDAFTYSKLNISSISPDNGSLAGGTEVTITGQDFTKMESTVQVQDFDFTGDAQQFSVVDEDDYILEVWGASGGKSGGAGGYSVGKVHLAVGDELYINVGESGGSGCLGRVTFGGGGAGIGTNGVCSGSGGGASDVRVGVDSLKARVIVAGGGGGFASDVPLTQYLGHGFGGGINGSAGSRAVEYGGLSSGGGGTQVSGGVAGIFLGSPDPSVADWGVAGSFGLGGDAQHANFSPVAGGAGGGWYGGGSGAAMDVSQGGGGGSGWVYTAGSHTDWLNIADSADTTGWLLGTEYYLQNSQTIAGNLSAPDHSNAGQYSNGNVGHGHVRISRYVPDVTAISTRKVIMDANGDPAPCTISSWTDTQIICTTSAHSYGLIDVTIGNDVELAVYTDGYFYRDPPVIDSVSPNSGLASGGTEVTISGSGFGVYKDDVDSTVVFGSAPCAVTSWTDTEIICTTGLHDDGLVDMVISNGPYHSALGPAMFTYYGIVVTGVDPDIVSTDGQKEVTIYGEGFEDITSVFIDDQPCIEYTVVSGSEIKCIVPPHVKGRVDVTVNREDSKSYTLIGGIEYIESKPPLPSLPPFLPFPLPPNTGLFRIGDVVVTNYGLFVATMVVVLGLLIVLVVKRKSAQKSQP
ncbi:MAG: IPT/TIG domain-containing protein [Candidatus Nomurabacteria bacterium]|jgi:hypothetical protein|nr:IPT/TIG domain-containing protein [Candidatus Nomurabacteria bacterium]